MQKGSGRPGLWFAVAVVVVVIAGSTGWVASDIVEADNDFCNACHLPSGAVLHEGIRTGFDARPVHTVAGLHGSATVGEGDALGKSGSTPTGLQGHSLRTSLSIARPLRAGARDKGHGRTRKGTSGGAQRLPPSASARGALTVNALWTKASRAQHSQ